jgi:hypothetical protein
MSRYNIISIEKKMQKKAITTLLAKNSSKARLFMSAA